MDCFNLKSLLLLDNHFGGDISTLDFTKLKRLETIDLGENKFVGKIPDNLCSCRSLTVVRLAHNELVGEILPCIASLTSLKHLALSYNSLSNIVGALKTLNHCEKLEVLFLSSSFCDGMIPNENELQQLTGFQNLQIFALVECGLKGQIPSWISKLRNLKNLNLAYNKISGPIPAWLGTMPSLLSVNLTYNSLSRNLPPEISQMSALVAGNLSSYLSYLALSFVVNDLQYRLLLNVHRSLKLGNNNLSGNIPAEIGRLKLLQVLELSNNNFSGNIPDQLSRLTNLERLTMSGNHLSGEIPESLAELHFLNLFSMADNGLQGEIPRGGQFDTLSADSFKGNPSFVALY